MDSSEDPQDCGDGAARAEAYWRFLEKWRGEMPIRSSSARMIGDAPTICTALRCASMRLIALSSAPAQTKSMRSTADMSIGTTCVVAANPRACAICAWRRTGHDAGPRDHFRSAAASAIGRLVDGAATAVARALGADGGGSHDGGDCSNAIAYSIARSSNAVLLVLELQELERQQPRAFAGFAARAGPGCPARCGSFRSAAACSGCGACAPRRARRRGARAPASSNPCTDARSSVSAARRLRHRAPHASICGADAAVSLPVSTA